MATIITKNSSTASSVPLNTQLVQGELAVNVTDKRLFTENASGTVVELGTNPSTLVTSNTFLAFGRGNTEDMRLTSTGLGIGTSSPATKLHLSDATNPTIRLQDTTYVGRYIDIAYNQNGVGKPDLVISRAVGGSPSTLATLDYNGNLGLGVTPSTYSQGKAIDINTNMGAWASGSGAIWSYNTYFNSGYKYKTSDVAAMYVQGSQHQWHVAASGTAGNAISFTQAMTLDASGNLGIGTSSPTAPLDVVSASSTVGAYIRGRSSDNIGSIYFTANGSTATEYGYLQGRSTDVRLYTVGANPLLFGTNGSERARIDSSGNLLVGTTSAGIGNNIGTTIESSGLNNARITVNHSSSGSSNDSNFMQFGYGGSLIGRIVQNSTTTVNYATSSDYRLKEDVQPMVGALAKVAALKPCTYKWKSDGAAGEGFIAHELAEVCPQAVVGQKDAVNEDGSINPQGIDTSFLVATLTAAIQELKASLDEVKLEFDAYKAAHP